MNRILKQSPGQQQGLLGQGMVEFALVLPILLLVLLGIFAFGHFLLSYTLVTAASREAARFGIATGLSDSNIPRFRDCDAIRAAAVRSGSFAGVEPGSVIIEYDHGPKLDGSPAELHKDGCPIGSVGPGYIDIGDRIVVTIHVTYRSIIPLGLIPEVPLSAVTRRTLIRTLTIGEGPIAKGSLCTGTITRIVPPPDQFSSTSKVGEEYAIEVHVIADDPGVVPPGTLKLFIDDPDYSTPSCTGSTPWMICHETWNEPGEHLFRAEYDPGAYAAGSPCYTSSKAEPWRHMVRQADTEITYVKVEEESPPTYPNEPITITVEVVTVLPGTGTPTGPVVLLDGDTVIATIMVEPKLIEPGVARGTGTFTLAAVGIHTISVIYDPGDPGLNIGYNESPPVTFQHEIISDVDPTAIPTLTSVPTQTPTSEPVIIVTEIPPEVPTPTP